MNRAPRNRDNNSHFYCSSGSLSVSLTAISLIEPIIPHEVNRAVEQPLAPIPPDYEGF